MSRCQNTLIKRIPLIKGDFEPTANFSETCQMTFLRAYLDSARSKTYLPMCHVF